MMQAAVALSAVLPVAVTGRPAARRRSATVAGGRRMLGGAVRASAAAAPEADYSSSVSVFPMEACDLVGGEACDAQMYPDTKLGVSAGGPAAAVARAPEVEREYLAYDEPKTVFPDEACDDLGGEFCEAPYQTSK